MPTALVLSLMDSPNLTLQTQKDSAWDSYQMSIVILPLKPQGNILGKVYVFIMLEEKFMLNALAMQPYLCRAEILTIVMASIQKQFVRFLQAAHRKSSVTKNLLSYFVSQSMMDLRLFMS